MWVFVTRDYSEEGWLFIQMDDKQVMGDSEGVEVNFPTGKFEIFMDSACW